VTTQPVADDDAERKKHQFHFDRHTPQYREQFEGTTTEMLSKCPVAWSDTYGGHWVAAGHSQVFELARSAEYVSSDHDPNNERRGYKGIMIPTPNVGFRGGFIEMDPPEQRQYRQLLNPFLSPAAVARWQPLVDEVVRASLNEVIETGEIDFVDHLANIVPAVLTLAMLGVPLKNWDIYVEPVHASVYTPPNSPDQARIQRGREAMRDDMALQFAEIKANPRPGMINALANAEIVGSPPPEYEVLGVISLIIGGGFDTTTALTSHALEWLSQHPGERARLSAERDTLLDSATEELLRYFTPAPGNGRTISADCEIAGQQFKEGERLYLSWAMSNRDPAVFADPNEVDLARAGNRHHSFGLGIHRCIGSNVARMVFKRMLVGVLDRMPDYVCDPACAEHYETIGTIQGMKHLPATFTPGSRIGDGLDETIARLQVVVDEQRLAEPVTVRKGAAEIS
jgi:cytochrome P450